MCKTYKDINFRIYMNKNSYDEKSPDSIEKHAQKLYGQSLRQAEFLKEEIIEYKQNKGQIGQLIEKLHFGYDLNSKKDADFKEAGVELKVCPLKRTTKKKDSILIREQKGLSVKERLVLSIINYMDIHNEDWDNNSLFEKIKLLLLMFYIHENNIDKLDYKFELIKLWKPSENDLKIIKNDWNKIISKIKKGKAHELSEGDTKYLGACTKGATAEKSYRNQPFSKIKAKQRAFSFKRSYVDAILEELLNPNFKTKSILDKKDLTLEDSLNKIFSKYIGKTAYQIEKELNLNFGNKIPLSYYSLLSNKIMGTESIKEIDEFQKANITLKTIRLKPDGNPKENISFPAFKFKEIINEEWDDSLFRETIEESIFFFVVFRINIPVSKFEKLTPEEKREHVTLEKVKLWNMPMIDIEDGAKKVWETTKQLTKENKIELVKRNGKIYNNLPGQKDNFVSHVRPHGRDAKDIDELPDGRTITKQCFWLNSKYIGEQIKD